MNLVISFSGRENGNCDHIAQYMAAPDDSIVYFRDLHIHACSQCSYECFAGCCKYRQDDLYRLYESMLRFDKVFFIVPMYCGNPSSLYFQLSERGQDFFMHNESCYEALVAKLYIIGVYGDRTKTPDFIPCLEQWFEGTQSQHHVLGLERHPYHLKLADNLLDIDEVRSRIDAFMQQ